MNIIRLFSVFAFIFGHFSYGDTSDESSLALAAEQSIRSQSERFGNELMIGLLHFDDDGDNRVSLRAILQTLMNRGFTRPGGTVPKRYQKNDMGDRYRRNQADLDKIFVKSLRRDEAGTVGREEVIDGYCRVLQKYFGHYTLLDIDRDGRLSPIEYMVGKPVHNGEEVDYEGMTKNQRYEFARQDKDNNGYIAAKEWMAEVFEIFQKWTDVTRLTLLIEMVDKDSDGTLSIQELTEVLRQGDYELPEAVNIEQSLYWIRELPITARRSLCLALIRPSIPNRITAGFWSKPVAARYRGNFVVRYRAAIFGETLVVEAKHADGWHTYAMDNIQRAKAAGGPNAECELPTQITLSNKIEFAEQWRQSQPKNLSKPDIEWHTWGFENTVFFTRKLSKIPSRDLTMTIQAQVCNSDACAMANNLNLTVRHKANTGDLFDWQSNPTQNLLP